MKKLELPSPQAMFNRVWKHYVTDGNPRSVAPGGACCYLGPNGARCAASLILHEAGVSDESLKRNEGASAFGVLMDCGKDTQHLRTGGRPIHGGVSKEMWALGQMQRAHDSLDKPIEDALRDVAAFLGLEVPA